MKNVGLKWCSKCKEHKTIKLFCKDKNNVDGFHRFCKNCKNAADRKSAAKPENKKAKAIYNVQWQKNNPDKMKAKKKRYRQNPENYKKIIKYNTAYEKKKLAIDPEFRMAKSLRIRINRAVKTGKAGSAVRDLGCTVEFFTTNHIPSLWQPEMSWNNYGEWELDHIIPLSSFNLTDREQFLKAAHYTNIQPLWKIDNLRKSNKLDWKKE